MLEHFQMYDGCPVAIPGVYYNVVAAVGYRNTTPPEIQLLSPVEQRHLLLSSGLTRLGESIPMLF